MLENVFNEEHTRDGSLTLVMDSIVTVTVAADDQTLVYDHWEDGFVAGIIDPANANYLSPPADDTTTLILGDSNNANGSACDFLARRICTGMPATDDVLRQGDTLTFSSSQGTAPTCTAANPANLPSGHPTNLLGCVPLPRVDTDVRFDGGDYLAGAGGPLAVVHLQDPTVDFDNAGLPTQGIIAGASEMISAQAVGATTSYAIPIGEDIYGGNNSTTELFKYVYLNLVAFQDNTNVIITSPGAGNVSFSLDRGQHYSTFSGTVTGPGTIPTDPGAITTNAGTRVVTDKPISGLIFTGGDGQFQTRFYPLLPESLYGTDYITTAPGDDPNAGVIVHDRPLNLYIFNPDPENSISVTATDQLGSSTFNVAANSQIDFFSATGQGRFPAANSTVRLTADRPFWGVSAYDHQGVSSDWGHAWLATQFLSSTYTVSFSLDDDTGTGGGDIGGAPIHIAPVNDNTCVTIDFDNDGNFDQIQDLTAAAGTTLAFTGGTCANGYLVNSLESLAVSDPNDFDNDGTRVAADKPVAIS